MTMSAIFKGPHSSSAHGDSFYLLRSLMPSARNENVLAAPPSPSPSDEKGAPEGTYKADIDTSTVDERKLLRKIDLALIPWLSLLYLLSFLDRTSIGNAKVCLHFRTTF
jgi:hypothetical protein